jgi:hypothetical protein
MTGHADSTTGEHYFWGIRISKDGTAAMILDSNDQAVAGQSIRVIIDKIPAGTYQIDKRLGPRGVLRQRERVLPPIKASRY